MLQLLYSSLHLRSYMGFFLPKILFYRGLFSFSHPIIVNRQRQFTYRLVDFFCPSVRSSALFFTSSSILDIFLSILLFTSVSGDFFCFSCSILHFVLFFFSIGVFFFVCPLYSSLRLFYTGLFFRPSTLFFPSSFPYWTFFFHPIIHFDTRFSFSIGDFFLSSILLL